MSPRRWFGTVPPSGPVPLLGAAQECQPDAEKPPVAPDTARVDKLAAYLSGFLTGYDPVAGVGTPVTLRSGSPRGQRPDLVLLTSGTQPVGFQALPSGSVSLIASRPVQPAVFTVGVDNFYSESYVGRCLVEEAMLAPP